MTTQLIVDGLSQLILEKETELCTLKNALAILTKNQLQPHAASCQACKEPEKYSNEFTPLIEVPEYPLTIEPKGVKPETVAIVEKIRDSITPVPVIQPVEESKGKMKTLHDLIALIFSKSKERLTVSSISKLISEQYRFEHTVATLRAVIVNMSKRSEIQVEVIGGVCYYFGKDAKPIVRQQALELEEEAA